MRVDSLERLEAVFAGWRGRKLHIRERVPDELMVRARRAAAVHGTHAVVQAAAIDYRRLTDGIASATDGASHRVKGAAARRPKDAAATLPSYSRVDFSGSQGVSQPLVEVETPDGLKLRVFQLTPEAISLLSAISRSGRVS